MMGSCLHAALEQMQKAYGLLQPAEPPGRWTTLVRVLVGKNDATTDAVRVAKWLGESVLSSPSDTADAEEEMIATSLARLGRARGKASLFRRLARWWLTRFGEVDEVGRWSGSTESLREELVRLPGVSLVLADRLLLFVGDRAVCPIDRPTLRLCCRHGWMTAEAEYEQWQSFLVGGLDADPALLREFWLLAARVGKEHCGRVPLCDACPLEPLLPPTGPYEPEPS